MFLKTAKVSPFRSINTQQAVQIDLDVTAFVEMSGAGKTVLLKALQRSHDVIGTEKFDSVEDFPCNDLSACLKKHKTESAIACELTRYLTTRYPGPTH